jgi:SAM-dependent methyltransferase
VTAAVTGSAPAGTGTGSPDGAALYDWECRHVLGRHHQDLGFWRHLAGETGGPVLGLACGTGRLTWPLADAGVDMVGLDIDPVMLAAARRRGLPPRPGGTGLPRWVAADMRHFALARRFALVFVAYNSLQLLAAPADMARCLVRARDHLLPDGSIGVEVTDFQVDGADGPIEEDPVLLAAAEGICLYGTLVHDFASRTSRYRRRFAGDGWSHVSDVVVRSLNRQELAGLFDEAGLRPCRWEELGATTRAVVAPEGR